MKVDVVKLKDLVDEKYLTVKKHPEADIFIWNYTQTCQFEKFWTPETLMCRGLITDLEGNVQARPLEKFFNLEEHQESDKVPDEPFTVYEKYDGSLGILYWIGDDPHIATRGSFSSDQAMKANVMLGDFSKKQIDFLRDNKEYTFLWEIIFPENRIVINYGSEEKLVLLTARNIKTGKDFDMSELELAGVEFETARVEQGKYSYAALKENRDNSEGYVLVFDSGLRLKVKHTEYVRLHRLVTGINERRIWDMLRNDEPVDELLERVPDEFYDWVKKVVHDLGSSYHTIAQMASVTVKKATAADDDRKRQAEVIKVSEYPSVAFAMLNGKDYKPLIWRLIKPVANKPFKAVI